MKKVILDMNICRTAEEAHEYLARQFGFPEHYGRNLDALYDCLTEITDNTCAVFLEPAEDREEYHAFLCRLKKVLADAEEDNMHFGVIFEDGE